MTVHYPKLYNMAHLSLNVFTASKGSNNYILLSVFKQYCVAEIIRHGQQSHTVTFVAEDNKHK